MNEKLIELAKAAGFEIQDNTAHIADEKNGLPCVLECTAKLTKFAQLVREDERKSIGETQQISIKDMGTFTVLMEVACHILDLEMQLLHERTNKWQSMDSAPKDGTIIAAYKVIRWRPYKPNSAQFKSGILGRWQEHDYGWTNVSYEPSHWQPLPPQESEAQVG